MCKQGATGYNHEQILRSDDDGMGQIEPQPAVLTSNERQNEVSSTPVDDEGFPIQVNQFNDKVNHNDGPMMLPQIAQNHRMNQGSRNQFVHDLRRPHSQEAFMERNMLGAPQESIQMHLEELKQNNQLQMLSSSDRANILQSARGH